MNPQHSPPDDQPLSYPTRMIGPNTLRQDDAFADLSASPMQITGPNHLHPNARLSYTASTSEALLGILGGITWFLFCAFFAYMAYQQHLRGMGNGSEGGAIVLLILASLGLYYALSMSSLTIDAESIVYKGLFKCYEMKWEEIGTIEYSSDLIFVSKNGCKRLIAFSCGSARWSGAEAKEFEHLFRSIIKLRKITEIDHLKTINFRSSRNTRKH